MRLMGLKFKDIEGRFIAVELLDGSKIFGRVSKWGREVVWVLDTKTCNVIDVPKEITQRILVSF